MVDRNLQNFYGRINRIQSIHEAGGGFEAEGALGMSFYNARRRRPRRRLGLLGPLAVVAMVIVGVKSAVHAMIGQEVYDERVASLAAGATAERAAAYVLQADPLTVIIADRIRQTLY
jgi:hypothetical protein